MEYNIEYFTHDKQNTEVVRNSLNKIKSLSKILLTENEVPNTLMITYKNVDDIPSEILEMWENLNPRLEIKLFGDSDCYNYLLENYNKLKAERFTKLPDGPIKADYFRVHYMFLEGGFYADADIKPIKSIQNIRCGKRITTIKSNPSSYLNCENLNIDRELNPMFFSCSKKHIGLEMAVEIYNILFEKFPYDYWTYSVVKIFTFIYDIYPDIFFLPMEEIIDINNRENDYVFDSRIGNSHILMYNRNFNYDSKIHKYIF